MREQMREVALRWMAEIWQKGKSAAVDELHAPRFVDRSPGKRNGDNDGFKAGVRSHYRAFPDFYAAPDELIIDERSQRVAIIWSATGTHLGEYLGKPASGKWITFRGIEVLKVENGMVTERWGEWDGMDLLSQLGLWHGQP